MPKLNQINALLTGRKGEAEKGVGEAYKIVQKADLFGGRQRTYRPHDEVNGEKLPPESQKVVHTAKELLDSAAARWTELWDLTVTQDSANQSAKADILVDDQPLLTDVPVTTLLFLEKQVNDVETFVSKLPTPDLAEEWTHDGASGLLKSKPVESVRTKKEPSHYEKAPATKEHPAQVEFFFKDVPVGTWTTVLYSGAIQVDQKNAILARAKKLKDAIKLAREQANMIEVTPRKIGAALLGYLTGK